jgi:hypothetical protein
MSYALVMVITWWVGAYPQQHVFIGFAPSASACQLRLIQEARGEMRFAYCIPERAIYPLPQTGGSDG